MIDTLRYAERLEQGGFEPALARAAAGALADLRDVTASKVDVSSAEVRLRAEIEAAEGRLKVFGLTLALGQIAVTLTGVGFLLRAIGPS